MEHTEVGEADWPVNVLEEVQVCPICSCRDRIPLHRRLRDVTYGAAPGHWNLWSCTNCGSAFLDPRPTPGSIGRAYQRYYTHSAASVADAPLSGLRRLRSMLANGYRNGRYGFRSEPASRLGLLLGYAIPLLRRALDLEARYLPRRTGGAVLDIGCGAGDWLQHVRTAGWQAFGAEPDPVAAATARQAGLEVRAGGVEAWSDRPGCFDAVTMNHVIEHVHAPRDTLEQTMRLLRPGGHLFIDTPNIAALGHQVYGANWRGLEVPRHLVLFNLKSLRHLLQEVGFVGICQCPRKSPVGFIIEASNGIAEANPDHGPPPLDAVGQQILRRRSKARGPDVEYLTLICRRPTE